MSNLDDQYEHYTRLAEEALMIGSGEMSSLRDQYDHYASLAEEEVRQDLTWAQRAVYYERLADEALAESAAEQYARLLDEVQTGEVVQADGGMQTWADLASRYARLAEAARIASDLAEHYARLAEDARAVEEARAGDGAQAAEGLMPWAERADYCTRLARLAEEAQIEAAKAHPAGGDQ